MYIHTLTNSCGGLEDWSRSGGPNWAFHFSATRDKTEMMSQLPSATGMMQAFANADGIGPVFPSARPQICPGWPGWYFGIMARCAQPGRRNKKGVETHISTGVALVHREPPSPAPVRLTKINCISMKPLRFLQAWQCEPDKRAPLRLSSKVKHPANQG